MCQAIEVYDGKTCFYSLSNFMSSPAKSMNSKVLHPYEMTLDPDYPHLPWRAGSARRQAVLSERADPNVVSPALIDPRLRPESCRRAMRTSPIWCATWNGRRKACAPLHGQATRL
jgi:hypothetical protein